MTIALLGTGFLLGIGFTIGILSVAICTGGIEYDDDILAARNNRSRNRSDVSDHNKDRGRRTRRED